MLQSHQLSFLARTALKFFTTIRRIYVKREKTTKQKHFLENQKIIEIQEKNNKPFFNYSMTGYIQQKMIMKEFVDYEIINGKMIVKECEKEIVYMTYSQHQHDIFEDNRGTEKYKENFRLYFFI